MASSRFDRFLPLAGVLAGLLLLAGLVLLRDDPSSETGPAATFSYWQADHGQHQIIGLVVAPLIAFLLLFFGAGLKRRLDHGGGDSAHGTVAFGGALLAAATFALVGMLEAAMTNAAHEGERQAVYTLNQFHSYDWLGWNAAFAAVLLATASAHDAIECCPPQLPGRRSSWEQRSSRRPGTSRSSSFRCG